MIQTNQNAQRFLLASALTVTLVLPNLGGMGQAKAADTAPLPIQLPLPTLKGTPDGLPTVRGRVERTYRSVLILTFGGGTNEIQRDIIAMAGLQMPRSLRG